MQIPPRYREFIEPFISVARGHIENGHKLVPYAFVASFEKGAGVPVQIDTRNEEGKENSARAIAKAALEIDADCIFTIMEAWGLPRHMAPRYDEIVKRYGSVTNCPFRVDAVNFILETRHGVWAGQTPIEPRQGDGRKLTFGEVVLQYADGCESRYGKLLPARRTNQPGRPALQ